MKRALIPALALAAFAMPHAAEAQSDRRVRIINNTGYTMTTFQASNTRRSGWEEDMLGRSVVQPGGSFVANINDRTGACMFDLRAKFSGGRTAERRGINVCKITSWTINN
jgi:hypothetical protein